MVSINLKYISLKYQQLKFLRYKNTYKNLSYFDKSWEICKTAISNSKDSKFTQIHAIAMSCMAEFKRHKMNYDAAISFHDAAIQMLSEIGAKSDERRSSLPVGIDFCSTR